MQNASLSMSYLCFACLSGLEAGIPCVTDCVMAELEKLGHRYRVALRSVDSLLSSYPC
jgi:rRNA-processing protein FCF1